MRNRVVGFIVIGIAVLIGFIIFTFNRALTRIVNAACEHGPDCPMWGTIDFQTNVSIGIMVFVVLLGLFLVFSGREPEVKKDVKKVLSGLGRDERVVVEKVVEAQGTIFQSDLVDKTQFSKVKVTRILDKLEGQGVIERKRRGMTNVVILKH
ncbi:hypothetical protein KY319_04520 [Candidatus Woesearchaeota archaeon]|nr:hypothetical protein [Candidatus Woesearchaeota archaeon]